MTMQEKTLVLGEEYERLDDALDEYAAKLADADPGSASGQLIQDRANNLETMLSGVAWLIDQYGRDAEVVVGGLDAGEYARVEDRVSAMRAERDGPGGFPGARRNVFAAMGLVDAPFLDVDDDQTAGLDERLAAVSSGVPVGVTKWLEGRVNDLTTVSEGNFKRLSERLADTRTA